MAVGGSQLLPKLLAAAAQPKIPEDAFLGTLWAGLAISTLFLIFRMVLRWRAFRTLYTDDYLVLLAYVLMLGVTILWQIQADTAELQFQIVTGAMELASSEPAAQQLATTSEAEFEFFQAALGPHTQEIESLWKSIAATFLLYNTMLWIIKASFLVFFKHLRYRSGKLHKWWWYFVSCFTFALYGTTIGIQPYACWLGKFSYMTTTCLQPQMMDRVRANAIYQTAADITSDFLLISIPVFLVWNVRIPRRQKFTLIGMFSLTIFVIICAVGRLISVVASDSTIDGIDLTWSNFWYNLEMAISMVVSCLATFRQLLVTRKRTGDSIRLTGTTTWLGAAARQHLSSDPSKSYVPYPVVSSTTTAHAVKHPAQELIDEIVPLNAIQVTRDVDIYTVPAKSDSSLHEPESSGFDWR